MDYRDLPFQVADRRLQAAFEIQKAVVTGPRCSIFHVTGGFLKVFLDLPDTAAFYPYSEVKKLVPEIPEGIRQAMDGVNP